MTREFHFEMAHHLQGHDGLCVNIHGHSYRLTATLRGTPLNEPGNPKDGMVVDFSDFKTLVEKAALNVLDHALVLRDNTESQEVKRALLKIGVEKVVLLPDQPTCENVLLFIRDNLLGLMPAELELTQLKLRETANTSAEWRIANS